MLWRSTVQREDEKKPLGFTPQQQQVQKGDAVFWFNEDSNTEHQPYPKSGAPGTWGNKIGPQASSIQVNMNKAGTFPYLCAIHEDETATILVATPINLASGANPLFPAVTINKGESVSWGNATPNAHRPTSDDTSAAPWLAQDLQSGDLSAAVAFATPGTYPYHCALHTNETSTIKVV
ncbi:MAG TPA: hypothetical protein VMU84_17035 [Thermoanaerobaculia bacterium]|nr:hypothetical protein [Thermoanaerobaculia bacterium]